MLIDEYAEGRMAYIADMPRSSCRYSDQLHETRAREMWLAGWDDEASHDSLMNYHSISNPLS